MKNAFVDADGVLRAWGFVETNEPSDTKIPVPENFDLHIGEWRYQDGEWLPVVI